MSSRHLQNRPGSTPGRVAQNEIMKKAEFDYLLLPSFPWEGHQMESNRSSSSDKRRILLIQKNNQDRKQIVVRNVGQLDGDQLRTEY